MKLKDIYLLAKNIEDTLPEIARENNGQNVRPNIEISVFLSEREVNEINKELYLETNKDLYGFEPSDEIVVEIFGIKFKLFKK